LKTVFFLNFAIRFLSDYNLLKIMSNFLIVPILKRRAPVTWMQFSIYKQKRQSPEIWGFAF